MVQVERQFFKIISNMLSASKAQQLDVSGSVPAHLKHPSFSGKGPLWTKDSTHSSIKAKQITTHRYEYIKIGKTFGFETVRYLAIHDEYLFYFDSIDDTQFKGYCSMQSIYAQWFKLKNGRWMLYLTNGEEFSFFYFESSKFWDENLGKMARAVIQLNYKDRYEEIESIGKGSFSIVMKVRDRKNGRIVAAKIINKKDKNKAPTKNLVLQERRILKVIKSQYVYTFEELYEDENNYIIIMEYLPGQDLMALWKQKKLTDPAIIISILRMLLEGIRDIHANKVIHRDLKPQNVLINMQTFKPYIIDFGLSLILDDRVTTKSYKRCGTMGYMAPQVIQNSGQYKKPYNNKCDIFSFGIIAHMLLLGYNPVKGDSYDQTYVRNKACDININKAMTAAKWGEHCSLFLTKCLAKYPQFRMDADQALKSEFFNHKINTTHDKEESSSTLEDKNKLHHIEWNSNSPVKG